MRPKQPKTETALRSRCGRNSRNNGCAASAPLLRENSLRTTAFLARIRSVAGKHIFLILLWRLRFSFIDEPVVEAGAEVEIELFPRDIEMFFHEIFAFILDSLPLVFLLRPLFTIKGQDMTARDALLRNARVIFAPSSAGCAVMAGATHHGNSTARVPRRVPLGAVQMHRGLLGAVGRKLGEAIVHVERGRESQRRRV